MKLIEDLRANVEMIPMAMYLFVTVVFLYILVLAVAPVTGVIYTLIDLLDPETPFYYDPTPKYDASLKAWHVLLGLTVGIMILRMFILAIKKQRYTGESEF